MAKLNLKDRTGVITLNSGHSIILGHKPDKVKLEQVGEKIATEKQDVFSFGLFDSSTSNYSTYYPDVTSEDLAPKDAEFIHPVFRMLSKTILSKGVPIDFSKGNVLKDSMHMMVGQTINIDHETQLGNAIGAITEVTWQEAYKTSKGKKVPAGFNGVFKIDGKSNPRIARGIMMDPPSIHSNSVTVRFAWEPSHTFESDNEFYHKLGTYDKDGELVRLIVVEIKQYSETSLVGHGADPYAQKVGADGKIVNPDYADKVYNFSSNITGNPFEQVDYKDLATLSFVADTIPKPNNNNNNNHKNMKVEQLIAEVENQFGLEEGSITVENFAAGLKLALEGKVDKKLLTDKETELETATGKLETADGNVTKLTGEKQTLETKVTDLEATTMPEGLLTATRDEAIRLYRLVKGDEVKETIISSMEAANYKLAESFREQYQEESNLLFPDTCQDCSSTKISKAKAQINSDDDDAEEVLSNADAQAAIKKEKNSKKTSIALGYSKNN